MNHSRIVISLLLVYLCHSYAPRIFYIGGATAENQTLVFSQLAKTVPQRPPQPNKCDENWETTKCPRVAVITSASAGEPYGKVAYQVDAIGTLSYRSLFLRYGLAPKHITVHQDNYKVHGNISTPQGKANLIILQNCDIIFFNGGEQSRHIRSWLNDDGSRSTLLSVIKARAFKNEIVISGTSAGSMVWTSQTFGGGDTFGVLYFSNLVGLAPKKVTDNVEGLNDTREGNKSLQYIHNGAKMPAFDFVDFYVDAHFQAKGRLGRLAPALVQLDIQLGFGVDQKTAFYYNNGVGTVYGNNGVSICDLSKAKIKPSKYFEATKVIGSYLTAGDSYDFRTKRIYSTKSLIKLPAYSTATNSIDILASFEASLLQSRLVNQKPKYNIGTTRTPSDFPIDTPKFEIKFYRNAYSKGYYSDKKYTVDNIYYDFSYVGSPSNLTAEQESSD